MNGGRFWSQARLLPLMLGKVLAGMATVTGCTMVLLNLTRRGDASLAENLAWLVLGGIGILIFQLCSGALKRRSPGAGNQDRHASLLAWGLLVLRALGFLLVSHLVAR